MKIDEKGYAHIPKDYQPTKEETNALQKVMKTSIANALVVGGSVPCALFFGGRTMFPNAPWLPSLQRSAALVAPLVFIYSFGYFSSRKTKEAFKTMPNSPLATAMLHNMEIYKKYGTRGVPQTDDSARPMSTTSQLPQTYASQMQQSEFIADDQPNTSSESEFERENFVSSSGGYAGGLDADASFHAKGETSSSSSDVTMAELRNRSRGPSSQSAPRRTVPPTSSQPPPPSSLPPPDPFSSQSRAPPNGILSGRGKQGSKYGDDGFY